MKREPDYLDAFEYMQGLAYRDALMHDRWERYFEKINEERYEASFDNSSYYSSDKDQTYQDWIAEREAPPGYAASWQEACADYFFLMECDGKCSICQRLKQFKGGPS